jgi:hypothetical protein
MDNTALISEMFTFHFHAPIFCTNGQDGSLTQVLFDASTRKLTHLAVKQKRVFGKTVYVPFTQVLSASGDGIHLKNTTTELDSFPQGEGEGVAYDGRSTVQGPSGNGVLNIVAVQPNSGTLAYIVVQNLLPGRQTLLRNQYISALAPGQINVLADLSLLKSLPPYRSDLALQREVEQIVFDLPFLHIDLKGVHMRVLDSVLYMSGNISSTLRATLTYNQVAGVEGLLEIKNDLVGDDALAANIARALGQDERTRKLPIGIYPELGVVRLSGSVQNAQQKDTVISLVRGFAGVRDVIADQLLVDPQADMLYVMSAPEGGETRDITPGTFTRHTK